MTNHWIKRQVVDELLKYFSTDDVLIIHGARQVGKTSILMYLQEWLNDKGERCIYFDLEDSRYKNLLDSGVDEFIRYLSEQGIDRTEYEEKSKKCYVFIDEIQYLDSPSSFLKLLADHHRYLKVIVSGSSSFEMKSKFKDSLVGRTVNFEIFPLSFSEFLTFKNVHFHKSLSYTKETIDELKMLYHEFLLYGGYPKIVLTSEVSMKERYLQQIIDTYIRKDIRDLAAVKNVDKYNRLLEILSAQSGNLLNISELCNTCGLARETVENYLFLLEQTYIIKLVRPFNRNIRSELTKTPKVFFFDTGLMQMLWLKRLQSEIFGSVFETSIFAELVKQYGPGSIHYWRTKDKREIDFVVRLANGNMPIESKLHFPSSIPDILRDFLKVYPLQDQTGPEYRMVALEGKPTEEGMVYPWQL